MGSRYKGLRKLWRRLHRDERGSTMLETLLIAGAFVIPLAALLLPMLYAIMQDYFAAYAFCVGWPFL